PARAEGRAVGARAAWREGVAADFLARSAPGPHAEPGAPARASLRHGARAAGRGGASPRPLPAHARLRRALRGAADRPLAALPDDLHWRFAHVGGGELLDGLRAQAAATRIAAKVAFLGGKPQPDVIALLREADLFVLPAKEAASGDRDGLPNVLLEAAS